MITIIIVTKTTTLVTKATARKLVATTYAVFVHVSVFLLSGRVVVLIGSLKLPIRFPQSTVCTANVHVLWLIGTSVQVTVA